MLQTIKLGHDHAPQRCIGLVSREQVFGGGQITGCHGFVGAHQPDIAGPWTKRLQPAQERGGAARPSKVLAEHGLRHDPGEQHGKQEKDQPDRNAHRARLCRPEEQDEQRNA